MTSTPAPANLAPPAPAAQDAATTGRGVAMLCQGDEDYGVGALQRMLAEGLPDLLFVCMKEGRLTSWLREHKSGGHNLLIVPGLDFFSMSASSIASLPSFLRALRRAKQTARDIHAAIKPRGIDIVHTHWLPQQIISGYMRPLGYKSAWQINNNMTRNRLLGLGGFLNDRIAAWGADVILPASAFIGRNFEKTGVPIRVMRNAAQPLYAAPNTPASPPLRCVIAGRMHETKGHHLAVAAVIAARKAGINATLDCFGGPLDNNPYADQLRATIAAANCQDHIHLGGFINDLRQRHQTYHLGLQCRIDPEPCSLWVCETLLDGLPLVASNSGGTPELVADGHTGLLFQAGNEQDITEKTLTLLRDPQRLAAMRPTCFQRGHQMFTPTRYITDAAEAYRFLRSR